MGQISDLEKSIIRVIRRAPHAIPAADFWKNLKTQDPAIDGEYHPRIEAALEKLCDMGYLQKNAQQAYYTNPDIRSKIDSWADQPLVEELPCRGKYSHVIIDAAHAAKPKSDVHTGDIVRAVHEETGCLGLISRVSRVVADLNRPPCGSNKGIINEYHQIVRQHLAANGLLDDSGCITHRFVILAIHGMNNRTYSKIEIGTHCGQTASEDVCKQVASVFELAFSPVTCNRVFPGDPSLVVFRKKYGPQVHALQLEIGNTLRVTNREEIVNLLCRLVRSFGKAPSNKPVIKDTK